MIRSLIGILALLCCSFFSSAFAGVDAEKDIIGYIGIRSMEIDRQKAKNLGFTNYYGSYVHYVYAGSPAEKYGVKVFDYIFGVNGEEFSNNNRLDDYLRTFNDGDLIEFLIERNGVRRKVEVQLARRSEFMQSSNTTRQSEKVYLGIVESSSCRNLPKPSVCVEIVPNSTADRLGLRDYDGIFSIDGYRMLDWKDISTALSIKRDGDPIRIKYYHNSSLEESKGVITTKAKTFNQTSSVKKISNGRAFLGVYVEDISYRKARALDFGNETGIYISKVLPESGAEAAGLMPLDYIYGIDEYTITKNLSVSQIMRDHYREGDKVKLHIIRRGEERTLDFVFLPKVNGAPKKLNDCERSFFGVSPAYDKNPDGVEIEPVSNSIAYEAGLQKGDRIIYMNGHKIVDWTDLSILLNNLRAGDMLEVEYIRSGRKNSINVQLASYSDHKNCATCDCEKENRFSFSEMDVDIDVDFNDIKNDIKNAFKDIGFFGGDGEEEQEEGRQFNALEISLYDGGDQDRQRVESYTNQKLDPSQDLEMDHFHVQALQNSRWFGISAESAERGDLRIRVFNSGGRVVYDYESINFIGLLEDRIDLGYESDEYLFLFEQNGKYLLKRVQIRS